MADDIENRIATALTDGAITSDSVWALHQEVETAAAAALEAVAAARERALDPSRIDPADRAALTDAEFRKDRLEAAVPRLYSRYQHVRQAEHDAHCEREAARLKPLRDAAAAELRELYPTMAGKLLDLFTRIGEIDNDLRKLNRSWSKGTLRLVEAMARGFDNEVYGSSVLKDSRLPAWEIGARALWPPYVEPIGVQFARMMEVQQMAPRRQDDRPPPRHWHDEIVERERHAREESEAASRDMAARQREREEREAAVALKEQREAVAKRNRAAGWG
jgi:hypothetical protein